MLSFKRLKLTKKVLHNLAKPVTFEHPIKLDNLGDQMLRIMHSNNGIGLAAPQVGVSKRIFVMNVDGEGCIFFNPSVTNCSDEVTIEQEGCLSFPGESYTIRRPKEIEVKYYTSSGARVMTSFGGLNARCFQHELDHLDGITFERRAIDATTES